MLNLMDVSSSSAGSARLKQSNGTRARRRTIIKGTILSGFIAGIVLGPSIGLGTHSRAFAEPPPNPTTSTISAFDITPSPGESSSIPEESSTILDHVRTPTEPPPFDPNTPPAKLAPQPLPAATTVRSPAGKSADDPTPVAARPVATAPPPARIDLDTDGDVPAPPVSPAAPNVPAAPAAPAPLTTDPDDTLPLE